MKYVRILYETECLFNVLITHTYYTALWTIIFQQKKTTFFFFAQNIFHIVSNTDYGLHLMYRLLKCVIFALFVDKDLPYNNLVRNHKINVIHNLFTRMNRPTWKKRNKVLKHTQPVIAETIFP